MSVTITREVLNALFTALNTSLNKGLAQRWTGHERWANVITSNAAAEKYPMSIVTGGMRKWIGDRVINRLEGKFLTVLNDDFERTEGVNLNDVKDDQVGFYAPLFEGMGIDSGNLWPRLSTEILLAPGKWADKAPFFSATRKLGKSTYNNVVNDALSVTSYETARALMMAYMDYSGQNPLGLIPDLLVVGPTLEKTAKKILASTLVVEDGAAVDNTHKDECEIQVNPYISGAQWFLMCTKRGIKPIVCQKREEGALQRWDTEHDECVKKANEAHYGLHNRGAAAAVCPLLVIGGNLG